MRRLAARALALSLLAAGGGAARAAEVVVRLELSPAETVPRQPVQATVTVTGAMRGVRVELSTPAGVTARAAGSSRNVQVINGVVESSHQYFFQIVADAPGTYQLGPAQAVHAGTRVSSNRATLAVAPAATPTGGARSGVFVEAEVSNPQPFVGEQVIYTLQLFRPRSQTLREFRLVEPETEGLWREEVDADAQRVSMVNGQPYIVHTVHRAYFPTRAGRAAITGGAITYQELLPRRRRSPRSIFDDSFFDMLNPRSVARRVDIAPVALEVRPLPALPAGVAREDVGVGTFSMTATLSEETVRVGDSLTLTVQVAGKGNLRSLADVQVPESEAFKAYPDLATVRVDTDGAVIRGVRQQRIALVPQQEGDLTIPALRLVTFDPAAEDWKVLSTPAYTVRVEPGENQIPLLLATERASPMPRAAAPPTRLAMDLLAPHPLPARLRFAGGFTQLLTAATTLGAPLLFAVSAGLHRRAIAHAADPTLQRRRRAGKHARNALRQHPAPTAPEVATTVANYVADRIGAPEGSITGEEAIAIVRAASSTLGETACAVIRAGEAARYGGGAPATEPGASDAVALVKSLDRLPLEREGTHA